MATHQRTDPMDTVTPPINAPPSGPYLSHRRDATNSMPAQCRNGSHLKRRAQRAERRTTTASSFPCKLRYSLVAAKISRGRRLAHRMGSTADLECQSQGCPASGRKSRPASRIRWGCPRQGRDGREESPEGRHRATGLYRTRPASTTISTPLYENASRLQLTPSKGA